MLHTKESEMNHTVFCPQGFYSAVWETDILIANGNTECDWGPVKGPNSAGWGRSSGNLPGGNGPWVEDE